MGKHFPLCYLSHVHFMPGTCCPLRMPIYCHLVSLSLFQPALALRCVWGGGGDKEKVSLPSSLLLSFLPLLLVFEHNRYNLSLVLSGHSRRVSLWYPCVILAITGLSLPAKILEVAEGASPSTAPCDLPSASASRDMITLFF